LFLFFFSGLLTPIFLFHELNHAAGPKLAIVIGMPANRRIRVNLILVFFTNKLQRSPPVIETITADLGGRRSFVKAGAAFQALLPHTCVTFSGLQYCIFKNSVLHCPLIEMSAKTGWQDNEEPPGSQQYLNESPVIPVLRAPAFIPLLSRYAGMVII
jgi:hypothetical protein